MCVRVHLLAPVILYTLQPAVENVDVCLVVSVNNVSQQMVIPMNRKLATVKLRTHTHVKCDVRIHTLVPVKRNTFQCH